MGQSLVFTVAEAAKTLKISKSLLYERIAAGEFEIEVLRIGSRILVPRKALENLVNSKNNNNDDFVA